MVKKQTDKKAKHFATEYVEVDSSASTAGTTPSILDRLGAFPVVTDSVANFTSFVKSAPLGEYVFDKSINTLTTVHKYAQPLVEPVQQRLQPTIVKALDNLEQKYPVVKQPTSEILDTVTRPPLQYYAEVKKTVETKVTEPATQAATNIAKGVNQRASFIVDGVEAYVDRWLPSESVPRTASGDENLNQIMRLYDITTSLPTRVSTLVSTQLDQHHIPHTSEDFSKLWGASIILQETTQHIENLNVQLAKWVAISKSLATETIPSTINQKVQEARTVVVASFDTTVTAVTANQKVQQYTQELVATLEKAADYAKQHGPTLPEFVQARLNPLFNFINNQYLLVTAELNRSDALPSEKAKNVLLLTQQQILPLMQKSVVDVTETVREYQRRYVASSERVLDGFKSSLKGLWVPVK